MEGHFISYVRILRPKLWIPSVVSMLIGFIFAFGMNSFSSSLPFFVFMAMLITGPFIGGGAIVLNQYFDYEADKHSSKKRKYPLVTGEFQRKNALTYALFLLVMGTLVAFWVNLDVFIITLIAAFFSVVYSVPPFRFKKRMVLDSVTNGICYGVLPTSVGFCIISSFSSKCLLICLPLFLGYSAGHMLLAIPDIENDKRFDLRTTAVALGCRNTVKGAMSLFLSMIILLAVYVYMRVVPLSTLAIFPIGAYILKEHVELLRKGEEVMQNLYDRLSIEFLFMAAAFMVILLV
jgi:4-hydroxybenzoate polyprenyltransferase